MAQSDTKATDSPQDGFIDHPLIVPNLLEKRTYQIDMVDAASTQNTLVSLPTGLGKTLISLLVTAERLHTVGGKSLLLAPNKPLVNQHAAFYKEALQIPDDDVQIFTGEVRPKNREKLWGDAQVYVATPQVVENDLIANRISLADVTHLTFDECHRATGDYAYNFIAEKYQQQGENQLITGMSASPGSDKDSILNICQNLGLENLEVRTDEDESVKKYTHETNINWERVEFPDELREVRDLLNEVIEHRLEELNKCGVDAPNDPNLSEKDLARLQAELTEMMDDDDSAGYEGMSFHAEIRKLKQAVTIIESQGPEPCLKYLERKENEAKSDGSSQAAVRMMNDDRIIAAQAKLRAFEGSSPKFIRARQIIIDALIDGAERIILFTEYRDTVEMLVDRLGENVDVGKFVGQSDKEDSEGMTQTEQKQRLEEFRDGKFDVLISTSVAEEGLDIPEVDLVMFYEPVSEPVRAIQRSGRTGRQKEGNVTVLMTEDTFDETKYWMSKNKQKRMRKDLRELEEMQGDIVAELESQTKQEDLTAFTETADIETPDELPDDDADDSEAGANEDVDAPEPADEDDEVVEVVIDDREMDSGIARVHSRDDGVETRIETLEVGDYILSDQMAVERKSVSDFLSTLIEGERSMFEQVGDMARHYDKAIVIIEGENLYGERNIHPNAIRGALASLSSDFNASVIRTESTDDTAAFLKILAQREQIDRDRSVSVHGQKSGKTMKEQQEYVISSIADVGPATAQKLLGRFGDVRGVMTATKEELMEVDDVGEKTAEKITTVVTTEYED